MAYRRGLPTDQLRLLPIQLLGQDPAVGGQGDPVHLVDLVLRHPDHCPCLC